MKKAVLLIVLVWLMVAANSENTFAQEKRLRSTPKAFQTFYAKFKSAMVKDDKTAVVSLTQFPFRYGFDAGDEGTFSKAQFTKRFKELFGNYKKLFSQNNPVFALDEGTFNLTSEDATHFRFEKKGASYKFVAMISEP